MPGFKIASTQQGQRQLPKTAVYTYTWKVPEFIGYGVDALQVYLKETNLPSYSYDTESVKTGHTTYQFAKGIKWADVKLSFYDTWGLGQKLQEIASRTWSPQEGLRVANEYMAKSVIEAYYFDGELAYTWSLVNSWIKSVSFSKLTYESSGINNANVTLAYSWAVHSSDP